MTDINQNDVPNEKIQMRDVLDLQEKQTLLKFNCHHIGKLQSFNELNQTATATIVYKKTYYENSVAEGGNVPVLIDYPILLDCPVICLGGGDTALTFPYVVGDECLVLFNDRDINNWFASGGNNASVATPRLHSFADGLILVGVRSLASSIPDYNTSAAEFRTKTGTVRISIDNDGVVIRTPLLTATFRSTGGALIENEIGNFEFADNADIVFDTGTIQGLFGNGGQVKFANAMGDLITALVQILSPSSTAGGFPFLADPAAYAILQSFVPTP